MNEDPISSKWDTWCRWEVPPVKSMDNAYGTPADAKLRNKVPDEIRVESVDTCVVYLIAFGVAQTFLTAPWTDLVRHTRKKLDPPMHCLNKIPYQLSRLQYLIQRWEDVARYRELRSQRLDFPRQ